MNKSLIAIILFIFLGQVVSAQVSALGTKVYITNTNYPKDTIQDLIVVYNGEIGESLMAGLEASPTIDTITNCNFTWYVYNAATSNFDSLYTVMNVQDDRLQSDSVAGYKVRMYNSNGYDTTLVVWLFFNRLSTNLKQYYAQCYALGIDANVQQEPEEFIYYNLKDSTEISLPYGYLIDWKAEAQETWEHDIYIPSSNRALSLVDTDPPAVDVKYTFTVTDSFNNTASFDTLYETLETYAEFDMLVFDSYALGVEKGDSKEFSHLDEGYSGPSKVEFTNMSINGSSFEWTFMDPDSTLAQFYHGVDLQIYIEDTTPQVFTYLYSGYYKPMLVSWSDFGCADTFPHRPKIGAADDAGNELVENIFQIKESQLAPTAKPDGKEDNTSSTTGGFDDTDQELSATDIPNCVLIGGTNSIFKIKNTSLKQFEVSIMDRWGKRIYHYDTYKEELINVDSWPGWDPVETNSPAGVYYYVIEAYGYEPEDPKHYRGKKYTGIIYVFDEKQ